MNALDKAFIKAYALQEAASGKLMSLSAALELSREQENDSPAKEETNVETQIEEAVTVNVAAERKVAQENFAEEPAVVSRERTAQAAPQFQPLLQVDAFAWPDACDRLDDAADGQLHVLADCVDMQAEKGRKMIGFVGDQSGSGCTTLLLSVARRLAERCRVALVDANRDNPGISRDLGLLPDVGLKDVATGRMSMDEALIESLDDHLTLLPYAGHAETEYGPDAQKCPTHLRQLANHYDLVLIDLGSGKSAWNLLPERPDERRAQKVPDTLSFLDAAVIVRDARGRRPNGSCHAMEMLQAAGVAVVGIVENRTNNADEIGDFYGAA